MVGAMFHGDEGFKKVLPNDDQRYVPGMGRNPGEQYGRSHLYYVTDDWDYEPMCGYGWNRSNGEAFSIFRGHIAMRGICKFCQKRADKKLRGVPPMKHKTIWL